MIKIAPGTGNTALSWANVTSLLFEKIKIGISRQPEIVLAENRAGMYRRGSLFDRRGILLKETMGILGELWETCEKYEKTTKYIILQIKSFLKI